MVPVNNRDPVIHLRVGWIYYHISRASDFRDSEAMVKAKEHYKLSLIVAPTAEAWQRSGVCAYRLAVMAKRGKFEGAGEQSLFEEAMQCLTEANIMDEWRPQINTWLVICAVEMGQEYKA